MGQSVEVFGKACHDTLAADPGPAGRAKVRDMLREVLVDPKFVETYLGPDNDKARKLLYEDELGFCIFAHVHKGPASSRPHDHGPSWAIYGQAVGITEMTDWNIEVPTKPGDGPGKVSATKVYDMAPGDSHLYNEGDVHSPERTAETRLIRIEGINMDGQPRCFYDAQ
ncbi:MAG: putative metal-dependent enzyme (double-stranded beta helix superfamily) [Gammaproteobacteria bacterium]|jgi:predicted metal-dependent enzyme (double-stranded beta helix superfamily)